MAQCAAGTDHQGIARAIGPARRCSVEIAEKTEIVGIVAVHLAPAHDQRIHRTDGFGEIVDAVAKGKNRFLMGNGDIAAGKFARAQTVEKGRQIRRRNVDRFIGAINAVLGEPRAVNERRTRMGDGVAGDESFDGHV